jgi:hypothetical protein
MCFFCIQTLKPSSGVSMLFFFFLNKNKNNWASYARWALKGLFCFFLQAQNWASSYMGFAGYKLDLGGIVVLVLVALEVNWHK